MSVTKAALIASLSSKIPHEVVTKTLDEYQHIKQQFFLRKFQPSELNGARFSECILRLLEHANSGTYTPFGTALKSEQIIKQVEGNVNLPDTLRFFVPRLTRVILDVRNRRDVAHVGVVVNPNYSDALFIVQASDWILTELVRLFHTSSIDEAQRIVDSINEVRIPIVAEIDGFVRIQNTNLNARQKALVILYYKQPTKVKDRQLATWLKYSNPSQFKTTILKKLDSEALIHYDAGLCSLLPKGISYVEKNIALDLLV